MCNTPVDLGITFAGTDFTHIAMNMRNIENRGHQLLMTTHSPQASASIFRSGKMLVLGCESVELNRLATRQMARRLQKVLPDKNIHIKRLVITNICGSFKPVDGKTSVNLQQMAEEEHYTRGISVSYEPEIMPALIFQTIVPKATFHIFTNGKINVVGCLSI